MIRNLLIVLGLLLCFAIGGWAVYRYLGSKGQTPFLKATAADLAGSWKNPSVTLKVEAHGEELTIEGDDYVRDGRAPRWVEKSPKSQIPKIIEWDGSQLTLTTIQDNGQRNSVALKKENP